MAGGKLSARQKMINLMYLVFIAMLAMKMDKEVLTGFGRVNESLQESNVSAKTTNDVTLGTLATKANEQPDIYGDKSVLSQKVSQRSNTFFDYLEGLKGKFLTNQEDIKNYETMDNAETVDKLFFIKDKLTQDGEEFINNINGYRDGMLSDLGPKFNSEILTKVKSRFNTDEVKQGKHGNESWIKNRFEMFPLVASITNITQMQNNIRKTESEIYNSVFSGSLIDAVTMTNYDAMVVFEKNAYYPGEQLSGRIVLGKNDPNIKASKVLINGKKISDDRIKAGQVELKGSAGNVGEHELKGSFFFLEDGKEVEIKIIGGKYSVIPKPNDAVISADKMNVVYRGLPNPISISIPGISDNKVVGSASGMTKTGKGKYVIMPPAQRNVNINATGTLPNGQKVRTTKEFRVKGIPAPTGTLSGESGYLKMSKANLARKTVGAVLKDFVFDLKVSVSSFKIKVPGKPTIEVSGTRFNPAAKRAIQRAKRGDVIIIFDIKAAPSGANIKLKNTSQVSIQITS